MDNSLHVLVEARKEYMSQLCNIMAPSMIEVFQALFEEAVKESKNRKPLQQFQKYLKEVQAWNENLARKHADTITSRCSWFNDLLAAVFVAQTKILSAVRLKSENKRIQLRVPSAETFIQACYVACAKSLYIDPYIFTEEVSEYDRDCRLTTRFSEQIEATVRELIPIQEILKTYMSSASEKDINLEDFEEGDALDPEETEDEPAEEEEPEAVEEPVAPEEPMAGDAPEPEEPDEMALPTEEAPSAPVDAATPATPATPGVFENEFRTVPNVPIPQASPAVAAQTEDDDEDTFFADAPERRVKKPMY
jgi:hypothetical protein